MQIKLFTIPVTDSGTFLEEMNRFLRANKETKKPDRFPKHVRFITNYTNRRNSLLIMALENFAAFDKKTC